MDVDFPPYDEQAAAGSKHRKRLDDIDDVIYRREAVAELRDAAETAKRIEAGRREPLTDVLADLGQNLEINYEEDNYDAGVAFAVDEIRNRVLVQR